MADRTDIDALLVGALYGELGPADEARLAAHLESHPADRTTLADLTRTRQTVRESRIFELQLEPPHAVSARLLQEAARSSKSTERAAGGGWVQRFLRSFAAHPAMAAAAMLVVVVGVAGTLYVRGHDLVPSETSPVTTAAPAVTASAPAQPAPANSVASEGTAASNAPSEKRAMAKQSASPPPPAPPPPASPAAPAAKRESAKSSGVAGIELRRNELQPKDFDGRGERPADRADRRAKPTRAASDDVVASQVSDSAAGGAASAPEPVAEIAAAPKAEDKAPAKPAPAPITRGKTLAKSAPAPDASEADAKGGSTWVRRQHDQVIALVRANDCRGAASAAVEIYSRAPDYYAANVAGDRSLKSCMAYIDSERERVATQRAKAAEQPAGAPAASPAPAPAKRN